MAPDGYLVRVVDRELDDLWPSLGAIALEGARGVGKTATASRRAKTIRALDRPGELEMARADPNRLLDGAYPLLIDEWQRYPASWDLIRRAVDDDPAPSRFLLTGSATPRDPGTHTGAGRIVRVRMRPLTLAERGVGDPTVSLTSLLEGARPPISGSTSLTLEDYARQICASGFPGLRNLTPRAVRAHLDGYLDGIIDRDFPELNGPTRAPSALRRWLAAYAAATATTATQESLRDAATPGEAEKPSKVVAQAYRDTLARLWILDPVDAWIPTRNHLRRLGYAPKHHLVDPALAARLLGAGEGALVGGRGAHPIAGRDTLLLGQLFESLVTLDVRVYAQGAEARLFHMRTHAGEHEVDLIVERGDHRVLAIEVKNSWSVEDADVRHLHWLASRLKDDLLDAIIVTVGPQAYRRSDGIGVVPAALLGP